MKQKRGFTLVEVMVVIAIVAVLATGVTIALQNARLSSRDARRISDINQIRSALSLYYGKYNSYPTAITPGLPFIVGTNTMYLQMVPSNPRPRNDGSCDINKEYEYTQQDSGLSYTLSFCLGAAAEGLSSGQNIAVPEGIAQ